MKIICSFLLCLLMIAACSKKESHENHQPSTEAEQSIDTLKKSIPKEEHAMIGNAHITIKYHAPAVRGRQIWGGLVPYDEVWVTGAHMATSFEINQAFTMNDVTIPAGKYALFTIPGKETWTFIVNKNWNQHLADQYSQSEDIIRIQIKPEVVEANQERLKYSITHSTEKEGTLTIGWEKIRLIIPFTL